MTTPRRCLIAVLATTSILVPAATARADEPSPPDLRRPSTAAATVAVFTQALAVTTWDLPDPGPQAYDGLASWIATANVPTAGPGQALPTYVYVHEFNFVNHPQADAFVVLGTDEGVQFAEFDVFWEDGREARAYVPFAWSANRFYLPFVYRLADGVYGGWIYDHTAATWTYIGTLVVPVEWGRIDPTSFTYTTWFGLNQPSCEAFPYADHFRFAPVGFVGTAPVTSVHAGADQVPGGCPAFQTPSADNSHVRYQSGFAGVV